MKIALEMRPKVLDDIIGQEKATGKNSILRKMINKDLLSSIVLYGPPGVGKTSIAMVISNCVDADFHKVNAVSAGKKDLENVIKIAQSNLEDNKKTILFVDEIHRFNKAQQDYLLPFVEEGVVILIGATTENPLFEVNAAIVSRSQLIELQPITTTDIVGLLKKTISIYFKDCEYEDNTLEFIADQSNGDIRKALDTLELASTDETKVTMDMLKAIIQKPNLIYDKDGSNHFDVASAFIKSIRGSDPNATEYYLARMLEAGEDINFIARRITIAASEDIGNADPQAICVATNAMLAVKQIGMPEARIILSQAALYLAMAPKCNTAKVSIDTALKYVRKHPSNEVPEHLRAPHYNEFKEVENRSQYIYPHDYKNGWCEQQYMPDSVKEKFYKNSHIGYENVQATYQNEIRKKV